MKPLRRLSGALLVLLLAIPASARHACVSIAGSSTSFDSAVSPSAARLLFAQRLGLSEYHALSSPDDAAIDLLNAQGGSSWATHEPTNAESEQRRILLFLEGVEDPDSTSAHVRARQT